MLTKFLGESMKFAAMVAAVRVAEALTE